MKNFAQDPNLPLYKQELVRVWAYAKSNPLKSPTGPSPQACTVIDHCMADKTKSTSENLMELIRKANTKIPENLKDDFQAYGEQRIETIWGMMMM